MTDVENEKLRCLLVSFDTAVIWFRGNRQKLTTRSFCQTWDTLWLQTILWTRFPCPSTFTFSYYTSYLYVNPNPIRFSNVIWARSLTILLSHMHQSFFYLVVSIILIFFPLPLRLYFIPIFFLSRNVTFNYLLSYFKIKYFEINIFDTKYWPFHKSDAVHT